jgi:hypothetical protein
MKNVFSKVFGLFAPKAGTPPTPAAESNLPTAACSETATVADQTKNNGKSGSSGASSHGCCGNSDTKKLPIIS